MATDIKAMMEFKSPYGFWRNAGDPEIKRDYELFSVLAGVQNFIKISPIDKPRGIADDVCVEFKAYSKSRMLYSHSHSWVTLGDVKTYDTHQEVFDPRMLFSRDENGKEISLPEELNGKHHGPVGNRALFALWGFGNWNRLYEEMEHVRERKGLPDDHVRICFFFED